MNADNTNNIQYKSPKSSKQSPISFYQVFKTDIQDRLFFFCSELSILETPEIKSFYTIKCSLDNFESSTNPSVVFLQNLVYFVKY